jgi:hypothetical protein
MTVRPRKTGRRRRNSIGVAFAPRPIEMLKSPAFRVLGGSAHLILARVEIEFSSHSGKDNGKLPVTHKQFEDYGLHNHAIGPALRELEALGFLVVERGCAGNAEHRRPSMYGLTWRGPDGVFSEGANPWKRITTIEEALATQAKARKTPPESTKARGGKRVSRRTGASLQ